LFLVQRGIALLTLGIRVGVLTTAGQGSRLTGVGTSVFVCDSGVAFMPAELAHARARRYEQGQDNQK